MWRFVAGGGARSQESLGMLVTTAMAASLVVSLHFNNTNHTILGVTPTTTSLEENQERKDCPVQGCVLLPRDIFYDRRSQEALALLRTGSKENLKKDKEAAKALRELIMSGDEDKATLTLIGYKGGDPDHQVNQDRAFVISPYYLHEHDPVVTTSDLETQRLMGVFDGHAHLGERVSEYSVQQIPQVLAERLNYYLVPGLSLEDRDRKIIQSLEETFVQVDKSAPGRPSGGCTASVILQMGPKLYIANAGDSVSFVVVHRASTHKTSIAYMSREDKPELPDERERIERMGGRVLIPNQTDGSSRALYFDTSTGSQAGLAMSRSLGDWDAARVGVIPNPIVNVVDLNEIIHQTRWSADDDDVYIFAVSASDGMMDFVDAKTIARELVPALFEADGDHPLTACDRLISMAARGWERAKDGMYRDDIAISVQKIRTPPNKRTFKDTGSTVELEE
jgi:serine/threonine protein phosphatase PrpC